MVIYLDVVILANFLLDYSLISYTGFISGERMKFYRLVVASLFAIGAFSLFFIQVTWLFFILRILWSLVIIRLAFSYQSFYRYVKNILLFYFLNYVTAGFILSYDFHIFDHSIYVNFNRSITWYFLVIAFLFANLLTYIYNNMTEQRAKFKQLLIPVQLGFLNESYSTQGYLDTGCTVKNFRDQLPIVFINTSLFKEEINESYLIRNKVKYTYISYKSVNNQSITLVFQPDYFKIFYNNRFLDKEVYIALSNQLKNNKEDYQVLLNYHVIF